MRIPLTWLECSVSLQVSVTFGHTCGVAPLAGRNGLDSDADTDVVVDACAVVGTAVGTVVGTADGMVGYLREGAEPGAAGVHGGAG